MIPLLRNLYWGFCMRMRLSQSLFMRRAAFLENWGIGMNLA